MNEADFGEILDTVRSFVRNTILPEEGAIEEADDFPGPLRQAAAKLGLFGFALPEEHGGLDLAMHQQVRLVFEIGYTSPALRSLVATNNGIAGQVLRLSGTSRQQEEFLPALAAGEAIACFALTEPEAGSDPAGLRTVATRDGAGWRLNGTKCFITNAPIADLFMVFARTSQEQTPTKGISCFLVPRTATGLEVGPKLAKMGQAGTFTADVTLQDVWVSDDQLVGGQEGTGYSIAMGSLAHGRLGIAALCVGMMRRLMDELVQYALARKQGGQSIAGYQLVQGLIADSQTDYMAARALVMSAAEAYDSGSDRKVGPACAKYFASEAVGRIADRAVQIHGGTGYMRGVPVERLYRDARLFRIYEGTSQIQQLIIARGVLRAAQQPNGAAPSPHRPPTS
jgi:acyl-CoA dehydrogenase